MKDTTRAILTCSERESQWENASFSMEKFACLPCGNKNKDNVLCLCTYRKNGRIFLQELPAKLCTGDKRGGSEAEKRRNNCSPRTYMQIEGREEMDIIEMKMEENYCFVEK
jgi:hypothetical protein